MRFEILIAENLTGFAPNIYLDTFQDESISFNFNIADITDISKKNSSYSKTISLPDTERNRRAFSDIFNIEAYDPVWDDVRPFNPNKKVACLVLGDTIEIFRGNLQLTNIRYDFVNNRHVYEVVIYSDNDTLFKIIGESYLTDLDLSRFDHSYNRENIEKSWGLNGNPGDYTNGYFYPLIDYGFPLYYPSVGQTDYPITFDKLYTSIYAKTIFDQILTEAGFSYTSRFLNSYRFKNLIIPFSNKVFGPSLLITTGAEGEVFQATKDFVTLPQATFGQQGNAIAYYYWTSLRCNVDSFDPNNLYNSATSSVGSVYKNPSNETFKQKFQLYIVLETESYAADNFWTSAGDDIRVWVKRSQNVNGATNSAWSNNPTYNQLYNPSDPNYFRDVLILGGQGISVRNFLADNGGFSYESIGSKKWRSVIQVDTDWLVNDLLRPGEEVRFFVSRNFTSPPGYPILAFKVLGTTTITGFVDKTTAIYNSNIAMVDILPTKVKQKDFLISIFKMFNLYIEPSKELQNHFIIEPRDEYYNIYQVAKDWSDKIDLSKDISYEILSNLQKRTNLFTYKADKDIYNTNYTTYTNEIFGQFKFELDNDFISDENKIEPIFSPTPINQLPGPGGFYLPTIANLNNGNYVKPDGMNVRILFKKMLPVSTNPFVVKDQRNNTPYSYTSYPFVGYADDPLNPNVSLNFGSISPFQNGYVETPNNLFNTYYRNQITELNDEGSRLITANFNLNSYDINQFKFSDLIYFTINNMSSWYRVTKIMDYDPLTENSTKVQLIKAFNYTLPFGPTGSTPSVEYCDIKLERTLSSNGLVDLLGTIGAYANSQFPILTLYNTYDNIPYSYGPVSESIGITDIELWAQTAGITGLSITFNQVEQTETFAWKLSVPCNTGPYTFLMGMSDELDSLNNIQLVFDTPYADCPCENLNLRTPYEENGLRNQIPTDMLLVGVLNTSTSNTTLLPNVAMIGENNVANSLGVVTIGNNNSALGQNSLLVGESNQITSRQSMVVGDTNVVNGKNTFALGSNNLVDNPQSFVLGYGNQLLGAQPESYTYSKPGTSSVFGTYSQPGTQSSFVIGNNNTSLSNTGFLYGSNNLVGVSVSNSFIFGDNNNLGFYGSGPSFSSLDGVILFGNNITIDPTYSSTQSFNNSFVIGNNITITQSISNTLYINTENIVSNTTGTASFNKMTIAELTIKDDVNYNPSFIFNQYNPANYPNGSNLVFNSPIPGLELIYNDLDGGDFSLTRSALGNINEIRLDNASNVKQIIVTNTGLEIYSTQTFLDGAGTCSIWNKLYNNTGAGLTNESEERWFNDIFTQTLTPTNNNIVNTSANIFTLEANIIGNDTGKFYFSKKVASFAVGNQIGTTTTLYEHTDFTTYSVDINLDGSWANIAVRGGTTSATSWKLYTKIYYH